MDREISQSEQSKSKLKKVIPAILVLAALALAIWSFRKVIAKTADRKDIRITNVEKGSIKEMLSAAGTVVAASERVINAPVTTEIAEVRLRTGSPVQPGDVILTLDKEYTTLAYEKLEDELSLRQNSMSKLKLEYDKDLRDLDYQDQIKALQLSELEAQLTDQKRLLSIGAATEEEVESADLRLKIARIEKKKLENELSFKRSVNETDKETLQLEYNIQSKRLKELRRKLGETVVKSPDAGVITWINEDIGKTVTEGEPLVKIANLDRYRIEGTTSDRNSEKLTIGMPVEVRLGKEILLGHITRILPEIENNTVKFQVSLTEDNHSALRPSMRTELQIITQEKTDVLRAKRGNALKGPRTQYVYTVRDNIATKTRITKGLVSSEYFEITDGLQEGDRIIISDTEEYDHMDKFEIK